MFPYETALAVMPSIISARALLGLKMKNVAKKTTSLQPNNPPQNGLQERLSNGLIAGHVHDVEDVMTVEPESSEANGDEDVADDAVVISDERVSEAQNDKAMHRKNSTTTFDETSNDSLLEVSCVNVVDDPNVQKSPFNDGNAAGSRSSTPASVTEVSSKVVSGKTRLI